MSIYIFKNNSIIYYHYSNGYLFGLINVYTVCVPMKIDILYQLTLWALIYSAEIFRFISIYLFLKGGSNIERYTRIKQSQRSRRRKLIFTYYICHTV